MGLWKRRSPLVLLLAATLLVLLPVLAFLQYRWFGQISQAERERMQSNLRTAVGQFRQDFDRELARAYLHFQSERALTADQVQEYYAPRIADWKAKSPNSGLIADLYWVEVGKSPHISLYKFDLETGKTSPADWPVFLEGWRDSVKKAAEGGNTSLPSIHLMLENLRRGSITRAGDVVIARGSSENSPSQQRGDMKTILKKSHNLMSGLHRRIIEEGPALIVPAGGLTSGLTSGQEQQAASSEGSSGYIVAALDLNYLKSKLIPSLVERHIQTESGLDYQVVVLSREQQRLIYQSSPSATTAIAQASDASSGLLAVKPEDFGNLLAESLHPGTGTATATADRLTRSDRFTMRVYSRNMSGSKPDIVIPEVDGYWQVFLKHRAGSLEAAVGSVRRRSIAISLGVLALLAASIALLVISTRREQRLAERQLDFVAGVSHELRTPLAVIRSAAENLADGYIDSPEHIQKYGALIRDEGRRLTDMVEQVLEVAGVQSGRRSYQMRELEVREILEQAIRASNLLIDESGFDIALETQGPLPKVTGDAAALTRAIQNLISNAIKYRGEDRHLNIRASAVTSDGKSELRIVFEDFGIGIEADELTHIFEPFYRARDVISAQIPGSGLGLSLVKHTIESHGGRIEVASTSGQGTVFTVSLPAAASDEASARLAEGYEQTHTAD